VDCKVTEDEVAHLADLSATVLKRLNRDLVAEKRKREAEATAKAKGSGERPTGNPSGRQPGSAGEGLLSPTRPPSRRGRAQGQRLGLVPLERFDGNSHQAPGAWSGPLPAQEKGTPTQDPVGKCTASTGEQAASSGRQLSYAKVGKAYGGVVARPPVKVRLLGWIPRHRSLLKMGRRKKVKEGGVKGRFAELPVSKSLGWEDVTLGNTPGGHLDPHPAEPNKLSGELKPTAKGTVTASVPAASTEAAPRRTSPGTSGYVSGPLSVTPNGATLTSAQVEIRALPGERSNKPPVYVTG
jgi:hypothetical protein